MYISAYYVQGLREEYEWVLSYEQIKKNVYKSSRKNRVQI